MPRESRVKERSLNFLWWGLQRNLRVENVIRHIGLMRKIWCLERINSKISLNCSVNRLASARINSYTKFLKSVVNSNRFIFKESKSKHGRITIFLLLYKWNFKLLGFTWCTRPVSPLYENTQAQANFSNNDSASGSQLSVLMLYLWMSTWKIYCKFKPMPSEKWTLYAGLWSVCSSHHDSRLDSKRGKTGWSTIASFYLKINFRLAESTRKRLKYVFLPFLGKHRT